MKKIAWVFVLFFATVVLAHEHKAPHGGTLIELGEEFAHLELVIDKDGNVKAYALDGEAEKAVRLKQKTIEIEFWFGDTKGTVVLKGVASALSGETEGDTSEFSGQDAKLKGLKQFHAKVKEITIRGKKFKDTKFEFPKGNH